MILDVVIGVVFVYLFLSLVCTSTKEAFETFLQHRPKTLEAGLTEILQSKSLLNSFYNHPLIDSLFRGSYGKADVKLPAYIPAKNFTLAVLDLFAHPEPRDLVVQPPLAADAGPQLYAFQQLRKALAEGPLKSGPLAQPDLLKTLLILVDSADGDIDQAKENIEIWYNSSMDRVSGWYKKYTQIFIFFIAMGVAVVSNADTFKLVSVLSQNKALRETLVKDAEEYEQIVANQSKSTAPSATKEVPKVPPPGMTPKEWRDTKISGLKPLGLPLGWNLSDLSFTGIAGAIPGWLITAIAISIGAPFWFDLLNKFMNVRTTLKPDPNKST